MSLKDKLHNILLAEDIKRDKKEGFNRNRLPIMLEALQSASLDPNGIGSGIDRCFCGALRNKLLRACGIDPKSIKESNQWHR